MSSSPAGARALLSLWNGIAPARTAEYERWHTLEHVPERVWVPGFLSGTRYRALDAHPVRYFTLYELSDLDCLASPAYQDLVDRPTPWSAAMRPDFRDFLRKTGPLCATAGATTGAALLTTRLVWRPGQAPASGAWPAFAADLLARAAPAVATRVRVQAVLAAGPQAMRNVDSAPAGHEVICLIDLTEAAACDEVTRALDAPLRSAGVSPPLWRDIGVWQLLSQVRHAEVGGGSRPAPREDLRLAV